MAKKKTAPKIVVLEMKLVLRLKICPIVSSELERTGNKAPQTQANNHSM